MHFGKFRTRDTNKSLFVSMAYWNLVESLILSTTDLKRPSRKLGLFVSRSKAYPKPVPSARLGTPDLLPYPSA
jgi:hypothetical protein